MRPIDADKFEEFIRKNCADSLVDWWCELVRRQPTIEAVPVVHGEWKYKHWCCFECSKCKHTVDRYKHEDLTPYCPNCGAKMKGGAE